MKLPSYAEWREFETTWEAAQPRPRDGLPLLDRLPPEWLAALDPLEALALQHDPRAFLRKAQIPPSDPDWRAWLSIGGRGSGKTFGGAAWVVSQIIAGTPEQPAGDIAIIGPTIEQTWDLMVRTIKEILPPWLRFTEFRSRGLVVFPDAGARLIIWSAENSEFRGPNLRGAWLDEAQRFPRGERLWSTASLALRARGPKPPRAVITCNPPRSSSWVLALAMDPQTRLTKSRMRDNPMLAPEAVAAAYRSLAGTIEGRRELDAEIIFGEDGALFDQETIDTHRVQKAPELARVIVAIDPSQSASSDADTAGVVALGVDYHSPKEFYVLASSSKRESPRGWARRALDFADRYRAGKIVVERAGGSGGNIAIEIVRAEQALGGYPRIPIEGLGVHGGSGSKADRLEPVASLATAGRLHLVGEHPDLEREITTWTPNSPRRASPAAADALSLGLNALTNGFRLL